MKYAGFWVRATAYAIDIVPISIIVVTLFYFYSDFGQTWFAYQADRMNVDARVQFIKEQNWIRETVFGVWLVYCALMEGSSFQGTLGKRLLGIRVVDRLGNRISFGCSVIRNLSKITSYIPFLMGFFWIAGSRQKHGWHDMLAKTDVVYGESRLHEHFE
ncbi:RDD family protein [Gimesia algae]|uniref:RDD family protein n=1 Tax=Gimesia algae TaxID=2527971 RepID=A0A517VD46_9PLAN|nr:RDD family protein [Gimesia algae]QDT90928.1 RDD family protein [Gimesia algae]